MTGNKTGRTKVEKQYQILNILPFYNEYKTFPLLVIKESIHIFPCIKDINLGFMKFTILKQNTLKLFSKCSYYW